MSFQVIVIVEIIPATGEVMKIQIDEIKKQLVRAASTYVSEQEALYFANCYIGSHLRKAPRVLPIQEAIFDLKVWQENHDKKVQTIVDKK